jgi:hypothetical protein
LDRIHRSTAHYGIGINLPFKPVDNPQTKYIDPWDNREYCTDTVDWKIRKVSQNHLGNSTELTRSQEDQYGTFFKLTNTYCRTVTAASPVENSRIKIFKYTLPIAPRCIHSRPHVIHEGMIELAAVSYRLTDADIQEADRRPGENQVELLRTYIQVEMHIYRRGLVRVFVKSRGGNRVLERGEFWMNEEDSA